MFETVVMLLTMSVFALRVLIKSPLYKLYLVVLAIKKLQLRYIGITAFHRIAQKSMFPEV